MKCTPAAGRQPHPLDRLDHPVMPRLARLAQCAGDVESPLPWPPNSSADYLVQAFNDKPEFFG